MNPLIFRQLGP